MSAHCCHHDTPSAQSIANLARYRRILWIALVINAAMFLVEIGAGLQSGSLSLLADGLYGSNAGVTGATVAAEVHFAEPGKAFSLDHPNVTTLTSIATVDGSTALVENTDYTADLGFGTIYVDADTVVVAAEGEDVTIAYTYGAYDKLEAFTTGTPPERWLRFEGLNTVNGDLRIIDIYRGAFDPLTGLEFINEELGSGEFNGNCLPDTTVTAQGLSQYFRERRVTSAA